ncbi:sn-glycerol-3-phosphate import ATP-binding protein UgpC [Tatumella ptyseos]|uniref:sn-glycerol-3-phosphate import ATP-binding protein UgpC n=1 Tax=Tatumella ptyseos TaxID=82987 RepID=UPI0026ED302F|nr:sn-glycerol-3-phosphate import ATP-binding protein UgpC [Tatumella ptyseos]WKX26610.1 sn-glycerol-3-phosphate import ATP-binding protein UgpC [Tatumella ptyseos]
MATVQLQTLTKSYDGKHQIIKPLNLTINSGEFVVIVGPSGCGKSTLLRMVAGLETVSSGDIWINDQRMTDKEPRERQVAMVFQNYALYPHMTVEQNMGYGLKIRGMNKAEIRQRVLTVAKSLELDLLLTRRPRQLSGGQRQRVAMGRAIIREPAVFLFDEPLSNLDARLRGQMRLELQRLHQRLNITSLYVTHDQVEAMTLADRVLVMNKGVVEQFGSPSEVYQRPQSTFVASFLGAPAMNLLSAELSGDGKTWRVENRFSISLDSLATKPNKPAVTLGIRPEHIKVESVTEEGDGIIIEVDAVEMLGADNIIHGKMGSQPLVIRAAQSICPKVGELIRVTLPADALHYFDTTSGQRLDD